jgi:hypothetical protein
VRTPGDSALATPRNIIVVAYDKPETLVAALGELTRNVSPDLAVQRFGQTVLVALPLEDVSGLRELQTKLEQTSTSVFVATPEQPASMRMSCVAASAPAAKEIEQEVGGYLTGRGLNLSPPWQPGAPWAPIERARYRKARDTYRSIARAMSNVWDEPALSKFMERMETAESAHDKAQLARLEVERVALVTTLRRAQMQTLRKDPAVDTAVIDAYALIESEADTSTAPARRTALIGPLLGQLPLVDGELAPGVFEWSVSAVIEARGAKITMPGLRFANAFQGPPALAGWLLAKGCGDIRYNFAPGVTRSARAGARSNRTPAA